MNKHFIVINPFEHQIDCFCPDREHEEIISIKKDDIIAVTTERRYLFDEEFYFLVIINSYRHFYMANEDLDYYMMKGLLLSDLDIELKINYLNFQIDRALENGDEVLFLDVTKKLKESKNLKMKMDSYSNHTAENQFI